MSPLSVESMTELVAPLGEPHRSKVRDYIRKLEAQALVLHYDQWPRPNQKVLVSIQGVPEMREANSDGKRWFYWGTDIEIHGIVNAWAEWPRGME